MFVDRIAQVDAIRFLLHVDFNLNMWQTNLEIAILFLSIFQIYLKLTFKIIFENSKVSIQI